jgi:glycosyltransferase involved in cell wall biosynthesis
LKVCILSTSFPRFEGDTAGPFVHALAKQLVKKGIRVQVVAPHENGCKRAETWDNVAVYRFPYFYPLKFQRLCYGAGILKNIEKRPLATLQVPTLVFSEIYHTLRLLAKRPYDLIHAHWTFPQGLVGRIVKGLHGIPCVTTIHGSDVYGLRNPVLRYVNAKVIRGSDACTANSVATAARAKKISGREDIQIIPMGVAMEFFKPALERSPNQEPLETDEKRILFVGRLISVKGAEHLVRALPKVLEKYPKAKALVVGSGPEKDRLASLAADLGLQRVVHFKGQVSQEGLRKAYSRADVVVLPSIRDKSGETEGLGVVLLEAMACGVPVIGSRVGGIPDIIKHGDTGLLVKEKDPDDLSEKLILLLSNRRLRETLIQKGLEYVEQNFSWDKISDRFINTYQDVLKKRLS